ncbi:MAG: aldehyde dehydrogenase family protein, partial [Gammaproteobacteria bacterium]|nr:aldehyde dehydrogenase family protein [Gammaproteobacteria bacterium]
MDAPTQKLVDISDSDAARNSIADLILEQGHWATQVFQRYDREQVQAIVDAVAACIEENAARYAEWAVRESGFGVVEDKTLKNRLTGKPLVDFYRNDDFINPQIDSVAKIVRIPRPAGVVFALAPSTNPIATINFKVLIALMTRNAIVVSPHPAVRECCTDAVRTLAACAVAAGAPQACIQVIEKPTIPLIDCFMKSSKTNLILATGGTAMVRAAYSSSNPAIGVGPGNVPVFVDDSADLKKAAQRIVDSKSFDNSVLCTNESVMI